jgi:hypothetical protein
MAEGEKGEWKEYLGRIAEKSRKIREKSGKIREKSDPAGCERTPFSS